MRILVTGGTGFLGGAFLRQARLAGHGLAMLSRTSGAGVEGVRSLVGSLAEPPWAEIADFGPEAVVHAAWVATPGVYLDSLENAEWVKWSRAFARRLPGLGVRHLTVLGTCIEYAITGCPLKEEQTPLDPQSPYARAKVELNQALELDLAGTGMGLAWARIFYPYGPGEHPARLASTLLARLAAGQTITLRTPRSTKDYIHEDDVGRALLKVVESGWCGSINIGTGTGVTVEELARTLAGLAGHPDGVVTLEEVVADRLDHVVADGSRIRSLGWRPQVALVEGLRQLVEARRG
jgi:dTDP-6-deoxy-L-talose 4-dehydrogenase (NAD+)